MYISKTMIFHHFLGVISSIMSEIIWRGKNVYFQLKIGQDVTINQ